MAARVPVYIVFTRTGVTYHVGVPLATLTTMLDIGSFNEPTPEEWVVVMPSGKTVATHEGLL